MRSLLLVAVVVVGLGLLLGVLDWGDRKAIAQAQAEHAVLEAQRDSLLHVVQAYDAAQDTLSAERRGHERVITLLRDSVDALERVRDAAQLAVREIRTTGALLDRFRATYSVLGDSVARLTTVPLEPGDTIGLEYLMVPAWFAESFIIDHQNAASWRDQRDDLLVLDSLRLAVVQLQDSITQLTRAQALTYRSGYDSAFGAYEALQPRYLAELRRPRVQAGSPFGVLPGTGTGILAAGLIR